MSWIQNVGKYSGYVAKNYVLKTPKELCNHTLNKEINNIFKNPPAIMSVVNGNFINSNINHSYNSPCYNHKKIFEYNYLLNGNQSFDDLFEQYETAKNAWKKISPEKKFEIFENIADLVENKYFYKMMAATMVGQGKNKLEAELDSIAETVDFLRFNIEYASKIYEKQPRGFEDKINYSQYMPLQGKVCAITPFNFTAIGANLSTAPLYFGNVVFWKPSEKSLLSNWLYYNICLEANVPPEVLNFVIMQPDYSIDRLIKKNTGGILFTGSTDVFKNIYSSVNNGKMFPRIIGETGGKNFHFIEESANIADAAQKTYLSAFNYSGQKCSACSIVYVPETKYNEFIFEMRHANEKYDFENYGLIDKQAYNRTTKILDNCKNNKNLELIMGGNYHNKETYFVEPTVFKINKDENIYIKTKELFAPVVLVKTYEFIDLFKMIHECSEISDYKLTGSFFSKDEKLIDYASTVFENSCGNYYINDKSTGSVVGNQPFGGFGLSGTNDKAGDINMLYRLFNQRNIKVGKD